MLNIPYVPSPHNACALACYTMIAKYYFPETTFEQMAKISDWQKGYTVWGFKFWQWVLEKGIKVTDYDLIDYELWVDKGIEGMKQSLSDKTFNYYQENTKDLAQLVADIKTVMSSPNFSYHKQKPDFEMLREAISQGNPCEVVLDSRTLDKREGFSLHRVVVTDIDDQFITFHDPRPEPRPNRKETVEHFCNAWLKAVEEPELCIYSNKD